MAYRENSEKALTDEQLRPFGLVKLQLCRLSLRCLSISRERQ